MYYIYLHQASREKPVFNVRKAGEGEDVSKFGKMILKKKESIGGTGNEEELEMEEVALFSTSDVCIFRVKA